MAKNNLEKVKEYKKRRPWKNTLYHVIDRCNNPKNIRYNCYGGRGIKCEITVEEIKELWFRDKAYLMEKPSIDRKDNDGDYTFKNCRFIELNKNIARAFEKQINQYDLGGNFIKTWKSIMAVERKLGFNHSNISAVCLRKRNMVGGFIWKFVGDEA